MRVVLLYAPRTRVCTRECDAPMGGRVGLVSGRIVGNAGAIIASKRIRSESRWSVIGTAEAAADTPRARGRYMARIGAEGLPPGDLVFCV